MAFNSEYTVISNDNVNGLTADEKVLKKFKKRRGSRE